jgi:hypothetical protein
MTLLSYNFVILHTLCIIKMDCLDDILKRNPSFRVSYCSLSQGTGTLVLVHKIR